MGRTAAEENGLFSIQKDIPIPRGSRDTMYSRTAEKMVISDSVSFSTYREATSLRNALKKLRKYGRCKKINDNLFRVWCVPAPAEK